MCSCCNMSSRYKAGSTTLLACQNKFSFPLCNTKPHFIIQMCTCILSSRRMIDISYHASEACKEEDNISMSFHQWQQQQSSNRYTIIQPSKKKNFQTYIISCSLDYSHETLCNKPLANHIIETIYTCTM